MLNGGDRDHKSVCFLAGVRKGVGPTPLIRRGCAAHTMMANMIISGSMDPQGSNDAKTAAMGLRLQRLAQLAGHSLERDLAEVAMLNAVPVHPAGRSGRHVSNLGCVAPTAVRCCQSEGHDATRLRRHPRLAETESLR
jgi:hypothetical protein